MAQAPAMHSSTHKLSEQGGAAELPLLGKADEYPEELDEPDDPSGDEYPDDPDDGGGDPDDPDDDPDGGTLDDWELPDELTDEPDDELTLLDTDDDGTELDGLETLGGGGGTVGTTGPVCGTPAWGSGTCGMACHSRWISTWSC